MTAPRPVTLEDPACFSCGPMRLDDGTPNPDYGKVFWTRTWDGGTLYYFDRKDLRFAMNEPGPPRDVLEFHGRLFTVAGPTDRQSQSMEKN